MLNEKKTILLTGASGFVGSYFIEKYESKYKIISFSFLHDAPEGISSGHFEALHVKDVDAVFHLSALVHQMGGASASEYERVNVTQTLELAKKAKDSGVKHFVFRVSLHNLLFSATRFNVSFKQIF